MKLYIAEKPSVAKAVATHLGLSRKKGYYESEDGSVKVTNAVGHLYRLAEPEEYRDEWKPWILDTLPMVPDCWKLLPSKNTMDQLKVVTTLVKLATEIIHLGDPDREGQLLIDEILRECCYTGPVKRMLLQAVDTDSIEKALHNLKDNAAFKGLSLSGELRAKSDWLVGMNATRAYTKRANDIGFGKTIPIGRVKTPTIGLLVRREEEIKNFTPTKHFIGKVTLEHPGGTFTATVDTKDLANENGYVLSDEELNKALQALGSVAVVKSVEKKLKVEQPPLPHSLDTLQVAMSEKAKLSPEKTLSIAQKLYENKWTTYPRSDCNYLPASQEADVEKIQQALESVFPFSVVVRGGRAFNDKKITAHHAIIPTTVTPEGLTGDEKLVYDEIALQYALQFQPKHEYEETSVTLVANERELTAKGKVVTVVGFKGMLKKKEKEGEKDASLPMMQEGDRLTITKKSSIEQVTKPPKRFTEATLLKAMTNIYQFVDKENPLREKLKEIKGIGTPATRASIISDILHQRSEDRVVWATMDKGDIVPTEEAMTIIREIAPGLTLPETTAMMELALHDVEKGETTEVSYLTTQLEALDGVIQHAKETKLNLPKAEGKKRGESVECPNCHEKTLARKKGKFGYFWGCDSCRKSYSDLKGKLFNETCPQCQAPLAIKKGKDGIFIGCSNYKNGCKFTKNID